MASCRGRLIVFDRFGVTPLIVERFGVVEVGRCIHVSFRRRGSVNCGDIAKVNWRDRDAVKAFYTGEGARECAENTAKAARILGEVIEKYTESGD